jgi:uncharacterized protein (TIGR00251 family)
MRIVVEVKAGCKDVKVEKINDGRYRVEVKAQAKKGKANKAVINELKNYFDAQVWLVGGYTSNIKYFEVDE